MPNEEHDYLLLYAKALSVYRKDPYNRRDNYFNNLLLCYGSNKIQQLIVNLRHRENEDTATQPTFKSAADKLQLWLNQWLGIEQIEQQPLLAIMPAQEDISVTVSLHDVCHVLDLAIEDDWKTRSLSEIDSLISKLKKEKYALSEEIQNELTTLLIMMPLSKQSATYADAFTGFIRDPELIENIINHWCTELSLSHDNQHKLLLSKRILGCMPEEFLATPKNLDMILKLLEFLLGTSLITNRQKTISFERLFKCLPKSISTPPSTGIYSSIFKILDLLIITNPIPEKARSLLYILNMDDLAELLIEGAPHEVNNYPEIYMHYFRNALPPNKTLPDKVWSILKPESNESLIMTTLNSLLCHCPPEKHPENGLHDPRLQNIDLYDMFDNLNQRAREILLDKEIPVRLLDSLITARRTKPSKSLPGQHLEETIRDFLREEKKFTLMRTLEILIMSESYKLPQQLLLSFKTRTREVAQASMGRPVAKREEQNIRLASLAILSILDKPC